MALRKRNNTNTSPPSQRHDDDVKGTSGTCPSSPLEALVVLARNVERLDAVEDGPERRVPLGQLRVDGRLGRAELGVKVLAVGARLHGELWTGLGSSISLASAGMGEERAKEG